MSDLNNEYENHEATENQTATDSTVKRILLEIWEWVYTIAIAVAIAFLIKGFLFDIVKVDGSSMVPTLENNDRLIVTKLGYEPAQGDIVILDSLYKDREKYFDRLATEEGVDELSSFRKFMEGFDLPEDLQKRFYVKRIIALPGQTVDLRDGKVYVDGSKLEEEYYTGITSAIDSRTQFPQTVEDNMVFVMGDNRPHSKDSRSSDLGQVPFDAILGKSQLRIWPLTSIGLTR